MNEVFTSHIPERRIEGKELGRHVVHDERSKKPEFAAELAQKVIDVSHLSRGLPLDQSRGSCTAESLCGARNSDPLYGVKSATILTQVDADSLYDQEIRDEGGDPATDDPGGSGLMVCKAGKQLSLIRYYRHAFGLESSLRALVLRPVMFGTNWYEGFDMPDTKGRVSIAGQVRGGHEYVALRIIEAEQLIGCAQSWGLPWGTTDSTIGMSKGGVFYVTFNDMGRLLGEQGDCTVPYV